MRQSPIWILAIVICPAAAAGEHAPVQTRTVLGIQGTRFTLNEQADLPSRNQLLRRPWSV